MKAARDNLPHFFHIMNYVVTKPTLSVDLNCTLLNQSCESTIFVVVKK